MADWDDFTDYQDTTDTNTNWIRTPLNISPYLTGMMNLSGTEVTTAANRWEYNIDQNLINNAEEEKPNY